MSEMDSEEVGEILNEIPHRADLYPQVEGEWFQISFEDNGTEYQLSVHLRKGIVALYDNDEQEEVFRAD